MRYVDEAAVYHMGNLLRRDMAAQPTVHDPTVQYTGSSVWWIVTPGADVYSEELAVGTDILEVAFGEDVDRPSRRVARQIHGFLEGGVIVVQFLQARDAADSKIPVEGGAVPAGGECFLRRCRRA